MPMRDGTGPPGSGLGRGRGWCGGGITGGMGWLLLRTKRGWLWGLAAPVIVAAVRDLANPSGMLRQCARALLLKKKSGMPRIPLDAQYSVLEEESKDAHPNRNPPTMGSET